MLCDQVSDAVLDACLGGDLRCKVACGTTAKGNMLMVAGEITTQTKIFVRVLCGESQQALASICMSTASLGSIARACATRPTMFW